MIAGAVTAGLEGKNAGEVGLIEFRAGYLRFSGGSGRRVGREGTGKVLLWEYAEKCCKRPENMLYYKTSEPEHSVESGFMERKSNYGIDTEKI